MQYKVAVGTLPFNLLPRVSLLHPATVQASWGRLKRRCGWWWLKINLDLQLLVVGFSILTLLREGVCTHWRYSVHVSLLGGFAIEERFLSWGSEKPVVYELLSRFEQPVSSSWQWEWEAQSCKVRATKLVFSALESACATIGIFHKSWSVALLSYYKIEEERGA